VSPPWAVAPVTDDEIILTGAAIAGTGSIDTQALVDAIYDEPRANHAIVGTFGEMLQAEDGFCGDASTTTKFVLRTNAPETDIEDFEISLTSGPGSPYAGRVTAYDIGTGEADVDPPASVAPTDETGYLLSGISPSVPAGPTEVAGYAEGMSPGEQVLESPAWKIATNSDGAVPQDMTKPVTFRSQQDVTAPTVMDAHQAAWQNRYAPEDTPETSGGARVYVIYLPNGNVDKEFPLTLDAEGNIISREAP
jgi:hypothetical protein